MGDGEIIARIEAIAAGLDEPKRRAEVEQHYGAMVTAMNASTDARGDQDALCVFEAIALLLAQVTAGVPRREAHGFVQYVQVRSLQHRDVFARAGKAARVIVQDEGCHG